MATSANNYYEGVTPGRGRRFLSSPWPIHAATPNRSPTGLNSKLVKDEDGTIRERVWKVGGMYSPAIEKIVYWLEKAQGVAQEPQKATIAALIDYYKTGNLHDFDRYNILLGAGYRIERRFRERIYRRLRRSAGTQGVVGGAASTSWTRRPAAVRRLSPRTRSGSRIIRP